MSINVNINIIRLNQEMMLSSGQCEVRTVTSLKSVKSNISLRVANYLAK